MVIRTPSTRRHIGPSRLTALRRAGVQTPRKNELLIPDDAANNAFDKNAARSFYGALQRHGVPMVVVSRSAAYACPVPRTL